MLSCENIRTKLQQLSIRKEEIRVERDRLMAALSQIIEEERVLKTQLDDLQDLATPITSRAVVGQDDDDEQTPKKQVRFSMDYEDTTGDFRVPAVSPNTPVDDDLHPEEHEFSSPAAAVARDMQNEFDEVVREEATVEEQIVDAFHYCIAQGWVTQRRGPWMKKKISRILGLGDESGIEIKTTITDQRGGYNFTQIRPGTKDHLYFCFDPNTVRLFVFALGADQMKAILPTLGSYAHGSIKLFGPITRDNIDPKKEYAIRPNPRDAQTCRNGQAWTHFIDNYLVEANDLPELLGSANVGE